MATIHIYTAMGFIQAQNNHGNYTYLHNHGDYTTNITRKLGCVHIHYQSLEEQVPKQIERDYIVTLVLLYNSQDHKLSITMLYIYFFNFIKKKYMKASTMDKLGRPTQHANMRGSFLYIYQQKRRETKYVEGNGKLM